MYGSWLPSLFLGAYFVSLWPAPQLSMSSLGWEVVIVLAVGAHFFQKEKLDLSRSIVLWSVLLLGFLGAVLSLLRAPYVDEALWNTVGLGINFVCMLLFVTTVATLRARRFLLVLVVLNCMLWTLEIQALVGSHGILSYSTFSETGSNKNAIGFFLAVGTIVLLYAAVFIRVTARFGPWTTHGFRLMCAAFAMWFLYNLSLIYARTAAVCALIGVVAILYVAFSRSRQDRRLPAMPVFLVLVLAVVTVSQLPRVMTIAPKWTVLLERSVESISSGDMAAVSVSRTRLLQKGLTIISDNPILGVGVGGSRPAYMTEHASYGVGLIHNSFLTEWADKGILGLLAYLAWLLWYWRIARALFWKVRNIDQLWLILYLPLVVAMTFKDFTSLNMMFLTVLAGIHYQHVGLANLRDVR